MISSLLITILELLAIVYLLWILFEQVINYEHLDDLHDNALNSLEKIRNERNYWMDEYYRSTSEVKADLIKQRDKYANKINKIKEIALSIKKNTCFGMHCGAIDWILKIIEGGTDINNIVSDTVHIQKIGDVTVKDGE